MRKSRIIVLIIAGVYLLLVGAATLYCTNTYYNNLPIAYLSKPAKAIIEYDGNKLTKFATDVENEYTMTLPSTCLYDDGTGTMKVNMVAEEDGPWGKRYKIKQTQVAYWPMDSDSENIIVLWRLDDSLPIAADVDSSFVYEGLEVQLRLR